MICDQISGNRKQFFVQLTFSNMNFFPFSVQRTMRELSQHTKVGPASRIDRLLAFNRRLSQSQDSARILNDWNLVLDPNLIKIPGRVLPYPSLVFGGDRQ